MKWESKCISFEEGNKFLFLSRLFEITFLIITSKVWKRNIEWKMMLNNRADLSLQSRLL